MINSKDYKTKKKTLNWSEPTLMCRYLKLDFLCLHTEINEIHIAGDVCPDSSDLCT